MRYPSLHEIFDLDYEHGLSTILSGDLNAAQVHSMIDKHDESGLYMLPAGPIPPNPAELLSSEQMRQLIESLKSTFTYILIDSPPVAYFTDAALLSLVADRVILVVEGGKTPRDIARESCQLLQGMGGRVIGVVLNNIDLGRHDYYYHRNYRRYSYGASEKKRDQLASGA